MVIGSRLVWIAIASVVGLLVAGFITYFAVNAGDSSGGAPTVQQTTTTEVPTTPPPLTESPTETPPAPTAGPTTTEPPLQESPTPDTRIAIRDLPTLDLIQLGPDGKYFIADRGDGCTWMEYFRRNDPDIGEEVFLQTDCITDFAIAFQPESGGISMLVP
jgi:hypothetical protein